MTERELFLQALDIPDRVERVAFLARACADRPDLRAGLEQLLQAHEHAGAFLAQPHPAAGAVEPTVAQPPPTAPTEAAGMLVAGRYKLLQQIGEGGMGSVWMADRTEPVKRRVAVKLIRAERGQSKTILARFEAERQAIALMDHPHIARLLDAGTTDAGSPFFVMELVKGVPLNEFCDTHKLSIAERLNLFMQVCSAVQHAHQKGVIHRDLKPTNILVESHDGKPVPKVIDFGLAKATTGMQLTEHTLFTGFGTVMGTPQYMAPEQANFNAVDIDTRADIFALGVILYELLTGTTPITRETIKKAALDEMLKLIREQEPPTPSSRLSTSESQPSIAANRQTESAKLGRFVKGELDWIVLKALAKERDRRYETANGFAKDIERFLNQEPVTAGPPSASYRLRKFAQRNQAKVLAAALVLLAMLVGIAGTSFGLVRADHMRRLAERAAGAERQAKTEAEQEKARAVQAADAERQAREREAVERAKAEKARDRTRDVLDAMTSSVTGDSLSTQQQISEDQKKFLTEVLTYYQEFAGEKADDEQTRDRTANAAFRVGLIEYRLGRKERGIAAYQLAQEGWRSLAADFPAVADYRQRQATSHYNIGLSLYDLGKRAESEEQYRQALAIRVQLAADFPKVPDYRYDLALGHNNFGILLMELGKPAEAEDQYRKTLAIHEALPDVPSAPDYHLARAGSHNNLAGLLADRGKLAEAEEHIRQALAIRKKMVADFPTVTNCWRDLAQSYNSIGILLDELGKRTEALENHRQALAIREKLAADFPAVPYHRQAVADVHSNLGQLLARLEKQPEAEDHFRQSLAIREKLVADFPTVPSYQIDLGESYLNFGHLFRRGGRARESLGWFDKAIEKIDPILGAEPRDLRAKKRLCSSHIGRAFAYDELEEPAAAVQNWDRAIELSLPTEQWGLRAARATSRVHAGMVDVAITDAEGLIKIANWKAKQWYDFARVYAVASGKIDGKNQAYIDRAMQLLQQAVKTGYKDAAHMQQDTDLDPLRDREDFQKLLNSLQDVEPNAVSLQATPPEPEAPTPP